MSNIFNSQIIASQKVLTYNYESLRDIDDIIIQLINESADKGFLKTAVSRKDGMLVYQTADLIPLAECRPDRPDRQTLLRFYKDLYDMLLFLEDSFIDSSYVVFDSSYVYTAPDTGKLYLAVIPISNLSADTGKLGSLLSGLLEVFGKNEPGDFRSAVSEKISGLSADVYGLKELIMYLEGQGNDSEAEAAEEIPAAAEQEPETADAADSRTSAPAFLLRRKTGEIIPLSGSPFIIGKVPLACDYVVSNNPSLSRIHAFIRYEKDEDQYYIIDCNSTNHIYLDGVRIEDSEPVKLNDKTRIHLATEEFVFNSR